jgi:hypothetical protein
MTCNVKKGGATPTGRHEITRKPIKPQSNPVITSTDSRAVAKLEQIHDHAYWSVEVT